MLCPAHEGLVDYRVEPGDYRGVTCYGCHKLRDCNRRDLRFLCWQCRDLKPSVALSFAGWELCLACTALADAVVYIKWLASESTTQNKIKRAT